jgi:hypothetical protein
MKRISLMSTIIVLTIFCVSCNDKTITREQPQQLITSELAKDLNQRYIEERHKLISTTIGKEDATAIWYSINELENYIAYLKAQGLQKGYDVKGIRFYLGVYPQNATYAEKAGLTTIFLAPTGNKIVQKGGFTSFTQKQTARQNEVDIVDIAPLNFGTMGNPPKVEYGNQ